MLRGELFSPEICVIVLPMRLSARTPVSRVKDAIFCSFRYSEGGSKPLIQPVDL